MNILSLFDGMSCGRIALERAEIPVTNYFASEIDHYAIRVSTANYPKNIQVGNVVNLSASMFPKINLLIGGSPCQGFSFAGKGLNFEDPRSKLFFEFVRLKNECNPSYFFLENVVMNQEYQDVISELLGVKPIMINSALVSAQNRKRLYWTNIPNIEQPTDLGLELKDIIEEYVDEKYIISQIAIAKILRRNWSKPKIEPTKTGCLLPKNNSGQLSIDSGTTLIRCVASRGRYNEDGSISQKLEQRTDFKSNTLTCVQKDNILKIGDNLRRLTEIEYERLQGVPDMYTNYVSSTQRYKMLGNGWNIPTITHIFKNIPL